MGVVVMHAKMVKSIERVSGAEKTSKQFKGINVSKTVLSSACCSVTSCNNEIKVRLFTLKNELYLDITILDKSLTKPCKNGF